MDIQLKAIKDILDFVEIVSHTNLDILAEQGNYKVSAKSIMGLFCLDLLNPIKIITDDENIINRIKIYAIKE